MGRDLEKKMGIMAKAGEPVALHNYDERAMAHGKARQWNNSWPFLSKDEQVKPTADEGEWDRYFRDHLHGFPRSYRLYRDGVIRYFNLPEANPQDFDLSYRPRAFGA